ncbi:MAG: ABC transporter permease [Lachnospiraceae bacterium]|nr:ABC transporter permease [Lachnospiraceae bacterium]
MSITAFLAFSQLRKNRTRSITTIVAIILSTSLLTAVCSFVVSGNTMLVELLGEQYGEYGGVYFSMLLIPAIILATLIIAMSIIVISNVFRISAGERIAQFGTLKCVGATKKQIIETVMYESLLLSLIGIPCGILLGIFLTYLGIGIANVFLDEWNSLVRTMVSEITLSLRFVLLWKAVLATVAVSEVTVLLSAYLPARKTAKISAMDCIRRVGMVTVSNEYAGRGKLLNKHFDIETLLAFQNVKRNRRNTKASVTSLSISIILFISLGCMSGLAKGAEDYISLDMKQTVIVDYSSYCERRDNPTTGRREVWYSNPMDTELAEEIGKKLQEYDATEFVGVGFDGEMYYAVVPASYVSEELLSVLGYEEEQERYDFSVDMMVLDSVSYEELCESAGIEVGTAILLNYYQYNDNGTLKNIVPLSESIQSITLEKADGTGEEIKIGGMLSFDEIPQELVTKVPNPISILVPDATLRGYSWYSAPSDLEGYMEYAEMVMDEYFPEEENASYMESGFSTRVFQVDDFAKIMNIAVIIASIFLYSFVILLALIGITNVITTMTTSVQMRSREFAVLQSVGMTSEAIRKMLNIESMICAGKAILYGLPIGLIIIVLLNATIRKMFPMEYCMPWEFILLSIIAVFLLIWSTIRITARKLRSQNVIETIRTESA